MGYEARRSEALRVNLNHLGIFKTCANISTHGRFRFSHPLAKRRLRLYRDAIRLLPQETSNSVRRYLQQGLIARGTNTTHSPQPGPKWQYVFVACSNVELNIAAAFEKCALKRHNGEEVRSLGKIHSDSARLLWPTPRQSSCSRPAIALRSLQKKETLYVRGTAARPESTREVPHRWRIKAIRSTLTTDLA